MNEYKVLWGHARSHESALNKWAKEGWRVESLALSNAYAMVIMKRQVDAPLRRGTPDE